MTSDRRPLATRSRRWPRAIAERLVRLGVRPDHVSFASMVFSALGAAAWIAAARCEGLGPVGSAALWAAGAIGIQLRLLCNLLDGLMAVEGGGGRSVHGELWNDVPDRISDALTLVSAGYASPGGCEAAGWLAALLAVGTAYVRFVGAALLGRHDFRGPLAKQQRMFVMTIGGIAAAVEAGLGRAPVALLVALGVVVIGAALTCFMRLRAIVRELSARGAP